MQQKQKTGRGQKLFHTTVFKAFCNFALRQNAYIWRTCTCWSMEENMYYNTKQNGLID